MLTAKTLKLNSTACKAGWWTGSGLFFVLINQDQNKRFDYISLMSKRQRDDQSVAP